MHDLLKTPDTELESAQVLFKLDESGRLVPTAPKTHHVALTIHQWTSAFQMFMSTYVQAHPNSIQDLLAYSNFIRSCHDQHPHVTAWSMYDEAFRFRVANDCTRSWSSIDLQLWLKVLGQALTKSALNTILPNTKSLAPSSEQTAGLHRKSSQTSFSGSSIPPSRKAQPPLFCHYFNSKRGCVRQYCQYLHRCKTCNSTEHTEQECAIPRQSNTWAFQNGNPSKYHGTDAAKGNTPRINRLAISFWKPAKQ